MLKSTLSELTDRDQATLDWQTQEFELIFDLPADGWYESLDLFLTAIPEGNVGTTDPITISYNGEKPISLYGQASRFDAHIKLDPARIRTSRNSLKIRYQTPHKEDCLTPGHGKWILDLSRSKLATKTRSKPRDLQIAEFKQRLNHPMTAPRRVTIRAFGQDKMGLEALVAQGIASRMDTLPSFQFTSGSTDLEILIGTQDDVEPFVTDKKMLEAKMTRAFTDTGSTPKLVLTGQTNADILALARSFATHELPSARRRHISLNEFYSSPTFNPNTIIDAGKYKLSEIGDTTLAPSWKPSPTELKFNVVNPDASEGKLTLNIVKSPNVNPNSRLKVRLNNQSIGYTMLDKKQKFVTFDIKPGMLRSAINNITIEPVLATPTDRFSCTTLHEIPTLMVSNRSTLEIKKIAGPAQADLNQFAASGAPIFSSASTPTAIVLTASSASDRAASLHFMGYAAQQFGPQFAHAEYLTQLPALNDRNKNILIIGPNAIDDPTLMAAAPMAFRLAMRGKPATGPNTLRVASIERYASNSENATIQRLAQSLSKDARIQTGGIASLFASPYSDKHMVAVVTSNRPSQFSKAMQSLTQPGYWSGLQGSVARWNSNTIMMAQTASILPTSYMPENSKISLSEVITKKWDISIGKVKSLIHRPQQIAIPQAVAPVTAKVPKPAVIQTTALSLRGSSNPTRQANPSISDSPLLIRAQSAMQTGYINLVGKATSFRDNDASMIAARKWVKDQAHNQLTLMVLIVISIVLMIGMATPKIDR